MADVTLTDVSKALGFEESKDRSTESYYGYIVRIDPDDPTSPYIIQRNGKYYYSVLIDGTDKAIECARLVNATLGDRVLVSVMQNGHSVVTNRIDGDLNANDAKELAEHADQIATNTLIYDHTYSYVENSSTGKIDVVFTAHLYRGGVDIASQMPEENFTWYYKTEDTADDLTYDSGLKPVTHKVGGEDVPLIGPIITIEDILSTETNHINVGYGLHIVGRYEDLEEADLQDTNYDTFTDISRNILRASVRSGSGSSIRVRDLEVVTSIYPSDKLMVVTASGEKLITANNLANMVDKHYTHTQDVVSDIWTIQHNLNKKPSVTVIDSGNSVVEGDISYIDNNTLTISFSGAFSGKAYCN